jgi:hypothetical protein
MQCIVPSDDDQAQYVQHFDLFRTGDDKRNQGSNNPKFYPEYHTLSPTA